MSLSEIDPDKKEKYESPNMPPIKELASGTKNEQKPDSLNDHNQAFTQDNKAKLTEEVTENLFGHANLDNPNEQKDGDLLVPQTKESNQLFQSPSKENIDYSKLGLDGIEKAIAAKSEF